MAPSTGDKLSPTDLIALAKQVNAQVFGDAMHPDRAVASFFLDQLQAFADLIRKDEREQCAVLCDAHEIDQWNLYKGRAPYNGTEEGRADPHIQDVSDGAGYCAEAIRARATT